MTVQPSRLKRNIGFILLGVVVLCWIAVPVLPFFEFPHKVVIITSILVVGEILFVITIALLGKAYWGRIKQGFIRLFRRKKPGDAREEQRGIDRDASEGTIPGND